MIIKDGDFYSALTHLKEAMVILSDMEDEFPSEIYDTLSGFSGQLLEQLVNADIAMKSCITDKLGPHGEFDMECPECGKELASESLGYGCCPHCGSKQ